MCNFISRTRFHERYNVHRERQLFAVAADRTHFYINNTHVRKFVFEVSNKLANVMVIAGPEQVELYLLIGKMRKQIHVAHAGLADFRVHLIIRLEMTHGIHRPCINISRRHIGLSIREG